MVCPRYELQFLLRLWVWIQLLQNVVYFNSSTPDPALTFFFFFCNIVFCSAWVTCIGFRLDGKDLVIYSLLLECSYSLKLHIGRILDSWMDLTLRNSAAFALLGSQMNLTSLELLVEISSVQNQFGALVFSLFLSVLSGFFWKLVLVFSQ